MRALVTGGAGFIGSTLVDRLLAEGHAVEVVDDLSSGRLANLADARADLDHDFSFHQIDICDPNVVELIERSRPEVVFHLAAQIDVRVSVEDPVRDARINVLGSLNVLEGARRAGTRKVVFASSGGTIYGEVDPEDLPVGEGHPQHPVSPYGVSKKVVSDYLHAYRELHQLEFTSLALANVYGPRQDPHGEAGVVAIFSLQLLSGQRPTIFGDGEKTRDYCYVSDIVDANVLALNYEGTGTFNLGRGIEISDLEVFETVQDVIGSSIEPNYAPVRPGEVEHIALDASKAERDMGWKWKVDLVDGVAEAVKYYREASERKPA